jgi:RimJ/RimL family protein N-acetyltransferase
VNLPYSFPSPLATERLTLRLMGPGDVDAIHAYQSREDVCRYLMFPPRDRETVAEKVAQHAEAVTLADKGDYWQIAMERQGIPGVIGDLYFTLASTEHATGEIGWTLHPDHHGNGYVTEGATAILELAFEAIGLHRVMAQLDPRNTASIALCKRLGMREEAYFVSDCWAKGEWTDTGVYGLLASEWREIRGAGA